MFELIKKDFLLLLPERKKGRAADILFTGTFFALFLLLEIFLFVCVMDRVKTYDGAAECIFTLFLLFVLCCMTIAGILHAERLFFRMQDMRLIASLPLPPHKIILSKLTVFLAAEWTTTFAFTYPLFLSYGLISGMPPSFYIIALFYPLCSILLETALVLLLSSPLHALMKFLKSHRAVYATAVTLAMIALSVLYYVGLTVFIDFATDSQELLFSGKHLLAAEKLFDKMIPMIWLVRAFLQNSPTDFALAAGTTLVLLAIGGTVFALTYAPVLRFQPTERLSPLPAYRKRSVAVTLIAKELYLLAQSDRLFSFLALLLVQPFLLSLVLSAIGQIFTSGIFFYFTAYLPAFVPLTEVLTVMLFSLTINQSANQYFAEEHQGGNYLKVLPVSPAVQVGIKLAVPYACSCLSLILSCIAMSATGITDWQTALTAGVLTAVALCGFELASLYCNRKGKSALTYVYLYALPLVYWVGAICLSLLEWHWLILALLGVILFAVCALPLALPFLKNMVMKEETV